MDETGTVVTLEEPLVVVDVNDGILTLTLNRPSASNALDEGLVNALDAALDHASADGVDCLLVRGSGRHFCVGGDVTTFGAGVDIREAASRARQMVLHTEAVVRRLRELEVPVVVGVHGAVAGAGLALVLAADLVVAARSTRFIPAYIAIGLTPDVGVSHLLVRAIGDRRAMSYLLSGTEISAETAEQWGLVSEVVDDAAMGARSTELAIQVAGSAHSTRQTKRLLRSASSTSARASAAAEADAFATALTTDVAQQRIAAFINRR